jgi:excisionase family DNA binding protein
MNSTTEWMTVGEAAGYLKVKPRTLLMWARTGHVKGYTLSGTKRITWRFRIADLDGMLLQPAVLSNGRSSE